jgi:dCTP deaminase
MYLSDRDLRLALDTHLLMVDPLPAEIDTTSIDLHLDAIETAKVWDVATFVRQQEDAGAPPIVGVGRFNYNAFAGRFAVPVPAEEAAGPDAKVYRDGARIIIKSGGFFLWQTREKVGTPEIDPRLICFVDGKSSRARIGLIVHMTAPTIHAGWWGQVTLEIANLGPFTLALEEGDAIAQIVVATISSPPLKTKDTRIIAIGQRNVAGGDENAPGDA